MCVMKDNNKDKKLKWAKLGSEYTGKAWILTHCRIKHWMRRLCTWHHTEGLPHAVLQGRHCCWHNVLGTS